MITAVREQRHRMPLARMARTLGLSRSAFYRRGPSDRDIELRDAIHAVALDAPLYGYRMITRELRRRSVLANEKRVRRIMRSEGLLCRRRKGRGLAYRKHGFAPYPNVASGYTPTRLNELWVVDFTYVRFRAGFIFVAVILDAFSRRCIGWSLAAHYRNSLVIEALRKAIRRRRPPAGFIHHSDRGGEYFDDDYLAMLREHGAQISMSRAGKPSDNAICERFMRTFKEEEVYIRDYTSFEDASRSMGRYLDVTYNEVRLHSSIGYLPPAEFEATQIEPTHLTPA